MIHVFPIGVGAAFQRPIVGAGGQPGMASMAYVPSVDADSRRPADGQLCTVFAVDVASFARKDRDDDIRAHIHQSLYRMLEKAFDNSGIPWAKCSIEDLGDGALIVIPQEIPADGLIGRLPEHLRGMVRMHNRLSTPAAGIQLRAAVHIGPVEHDRHGFVGSDINLLFRMLEARPLKHALAGSRAELALMVSDDVYRSLVGRYPNLVSPDAFQPVRFQVKQTRGRAWIYLPGLPRLASEASQATECDIDQAMAAFKTALAHMDYSAREAARIRNLANVTDAQEAAEENLELPPHLQGAPRARWRKPPQRRWLPATRLAEQGSTYACGAELLPSVPSDVLLRAGYSSGPATLMRGTRVTGIDRRSLAQPLAKGTTRARASVHWQPLQEDPTVLYTGS